MVLKVGFCEAALGAAKVLGGERSELEGERGPVCGNLGPPNYFNQKNSFTHFTYGPLL